jgi:hypothetical protein
VVRQAFRYDNGTENALRIRATLSSTWKIRLPDLVVSADSISLDAVESHGEGESARYWEGKDVTATQWKKEKIYFWGSQQASPLPKPALLQTLIDV